MIPFRTSARAAFACAALLLAFPALSHVTLEVQQAQIGGSYKAVFRVPHGCKGSPTVGLRVRIPEGMIGVKPRPKPDWTIKTVRGDYAHPDQIYGATVTAGVKEVDWIGGLLPDDEYDEFTLVGYLSTRLKPDTVLYFPVVQECEKGVERWIDIPAGGEHRIVEDHAGTPAPGVLLLPSKAR